MSVPIGRTKKATETVTLAVGDEAPDFTLPTHLGRTVGAGSTNHFTLSSLRGRRHALLVFFPLAFTPV
ncbi:MAG: redoxin domain-containing protein [Chloroflexota bacterium]